MQAMRIAPLLLVFVASCAQPADYPRVAATVETAPVASKRDAADDPAVWVNVADPRSSLILATDKRRGLAVYDLAGAERQFIERGRLNNVDLRRDVRLGGVETTLAAATNRTTQSFDVFEVSDEGHVTFRIEQPIEMDDPYGICMMRDERGNASVFVNDKNGDYQEWRLTHAGELAPVLMASFALSSQPEGCVVDDRTGLLYAGEESRGVWVMPADASRADEMTLIDSVGEGPLVADVEGMSVYSGDAGRSFLVVSSQGDDSFAVYHIEDAHRYLGSFRVTDHPELPIDGVQETDGLDITAHALGDQFPQGMLVVQDGDNRLPPDNQNFKLIDWREVAAIFPLR
ncbi:MAG: phytase [Gammaproteobacteria bacterium]|nr:phytase [Gammaproteobacteria bacterium]